MAARMLLGRDESLDQPKLAADDLAFALQLLERAGQGIVAPLQLVPERTQ
jgi:hypothetical protein